MQRLCVGGQASQQRAKFEMTAVARPIKHRFLRRGEDKNPERHHTTEAFEDLLAELPETAMTIQCHSVRDPPSPEPLETKVMEVTRNGSWGSCEH